MQPYLFDVDSCATTCLYQIANLLSTTATFKLSGVALRLCLRPEPQQSCVHIQYVALGTARMKHGGKIKQSDIVRALKAANSAGLKITRVEVSPDGKLSILVADNTAATEQSATPFDLWKEKRNARPA